MTQTVAQAERVVGLDVARALAILGMAVVHFSLVMAADRTGPRWLAAMLGFLDGRPAAMFVILAGVGVTLMSRRAVLSASPHAVGEIRKVLLRRGLLLLALGFVNLAIWPGDILRVYGVSMAVTGQMALTWYFAHIILGLGSVVLFGLEASQPLPTAAACGVGFFAIAVLASWIWRAFFRHGPLEWVMRKVTGQGRSQCIST